MTHATIDELTLADDPERWEDLGFTITGDRCQLGTVRVRLAGSDAGAGILSWSLRGIEGTDMDGLHDHLERPAARRRRHTPNGIVAIDHIVAILAQAQRRAGAPRRPALTSRAACARSPRPRAPRARRSSGWAPRSWSSCRSPRRWSSVPAARSSPRTSGDWRCGCRRPGRRAAEAFGGASRRGAPRRAARAPDRDGETVSRAVRAARADEPDERPAVQERSPVEERSPVQEGSPVQERSPGQERP